MKKAILFLLILLTIMLPFTAFAQEEEAAPSAQTSAGKLYIDCYEKYDGMNMTYAEGYIPKVSGEKAVVVLPLKGKTQDGKAQVSVDLGSTENSPFVFGNYSQEVAEKNGIYLCRISIPLADTRKNGSYPITFTADYLNTAGEEVSQSFTVFVTITDGKEETIEAAATEQVDDTVRKPELFISECKLSSQKLSGGDEFDVTLTIQNIGNLKATSIRLDYGSTASGEESGGTSGILPVEMNNSIRIQDIFPNKTQEASFRLKVSKDAFSGNQSFAVTLNYTDKTGADRTSTRVFTVEVTQPSEYRYDTIEVPKTVAAGETFTLPANLYNTGSSTLKDVMITVEGIGLFPKASAFLGDLAPGGTGNGEIAVFVGQKSMSEGGEGDYGMTEGSYIISYLDEAGEEHKEVITFTTEITAPVTESEDEEESMQEQPQFQWWIMVLVGFAVIAILVATIVVTKVVRDLKLK